MEWFSGILTWDDPQHMFTPIHVWIDVSFSKANDIVDMIQEKIPEATFTYQPYATCALGKGG